MTGSPPTLRLSDLLVRFGAAAGLEPVSLEVGAGERVALVGASGAGKTTLLRAVAGLAPAAGGRVEIGGRDVTALPPERRDAVYLHQTPLLFPHLSVAENVAFPLRVRGVAGGRARERVREVLAAVRLEGYGERRPGTLSGGQRHRVALARAIAARPALLLLDEPLSSLDPVLREEVRAAIVAVQAEHRPALVLVTHDLEEAGLLADRIGVLIDRRLAQLAPPAELFARPATLAVARFLGIPNRLPARARAGVAETPLGLLPLPHPLPDGPATLVFRPDALHLDPSGVEATVLAARHRPAGATLLLRAADLELEMAADAHAIPPVGATLRIRVDPARVVGYRTSP